jgi:1-deoxy-D-xylulose-5-phosphate reductoisomerase
MRAPIACAWAWPKRVAWDAPELDLPTVGSLTFERPDEVRFPALAIARSALSTGGGAPAAMNAANEVAVGAFLGGAIGFLDIASTVEETLAHMHGAGDLAVCANDEAVEWAQVIDSAARKMAAQVLSRL